MLNSTTGFVVGGQGTVKKTIDGGETWDTLANPFPKIITLNAVTFLDDGTGFIIGANGHIFKTTNNGDNWDSIPSGVNRNLYAIDFVDNNNGWISGANGTILNTTNGGDSWLPQDAGTNFGLFSIHFTDLNNGWAVGPQGTIVYTTNGGNNWNLTGTFSRGSFEEVFFINQQIGWIVGSDGIIIKTTTGGTVAIEDEYQNLVPNDFYLSQNYPNPFNPTTKIRFTVPQNPSASPLSERKDENELVTLKIYDILGKEIVTLVNEEKSGGIYEVTFNASTLSSGIYFYKLLIGEKSLEIKKMLLLK